MKNKLFITLSVFLAIIIFIGCKPESRVDPDAGENLLTQEAILAATGEGDTVVTKEGNKYKVSGRITTSADNDTINMVSLKLKPVPENANMYFSGVKRYVITIEFPQSPIKPKVKYGEGFHLYFENIRATEKTGLYEGSWQSVPLEEYESTGGVGTMKADRRLADHYNIELKKTNVGDYHHMVIRVQFDPVHLGSSYHFYISDVAIYAEGIDDKYPGGDQLETPMIHVNSRLNDAVYAKGAPAEALRIVPEFQKAVPGVTADSRTLYKYQWFSNESNSDEGGALIPEDQIGNNTDHPLGWNEGTKYVPSTQEAGITYYYVIVTSQDELSITSRVVKITVNE